MPNLIATPTLRILIRKGVRKVYISDVELGGCTVEEPVIEKIFQQLHMNPANGEKIWVDVPEVEE